MSDKTIVMTRLIDAPRERVWEAFTTPEQVAQWWGPNGFTNTLQEMEVKPGGVWRILMHGPDGTDYPNKMIFKEVVKPELLTYLHTDDVENSEHVFNARATFEEKDGKTQVTLSLEFLTQEEYEKSVKFGAVEGGGQTLGRLAEFVE